MRWDVTKRTALVALAVLIGGFTLIGLLEAARDAPTADEAVDLTSGLVAVRNHDLRMNPEHGLLHHVLPALLPALVTDPLLPHTPAYDDGDWFDYTDDVVSANDRAGRLHDVLFWFRVVPLLVGAFTGATLYALGARLTTRFGGLIVAGLWLTTPYVVGLAHLSSIDVSFAFALVGLALLLDRYRTAPTDGRLAALAVAVGGALLVRQNAVIVVPVVVGVVVARLRSAPGRDLARSLAVLAILPLVVVWASYRVVDPTPVGGAPRDRFDGLISAASDHGPMERLVLAAPMPIEWRAGFGYLVETADQRPAYLLGDEWTGSRWWFFPVSAAVKLPATASVALLGGIAGWCLIDSDRRRRAAVTVGALAGVTAGFLLLQPLDLGLRLAIPALALAFLAAASITQLRPRPRLAAVGVIAAGQLVAAVAAYPHSLAWTPPPFTDGYRAVSDSSIDFGQANDEVRSRQHREPFVAASLLAPRGFDVLPGVPRVEDVSPDELVGDVAVGATVLTVLQRDELGWLRAYCPVEVIGDSVLVYRFDRPPDTRPADGTPAAPCHGSVSRRR